MGSDRGSECDLDELDKDVNDCDNINAQSDDDDATIAKSQSKQSGTLSSDSEPEINFENLDKDLETINSKICNLGLNTVKEKADQYKKKAMANPVVSLETQDIVSKALSKHPNPVPCPVCQQLMKNELGVKLHMAKKH